MNSSVAGFMARRYRRSLEMFTLEFAETTCGVSAATLMKVAQMIAAADGVCVLWAMGVTQHTMASDTSTAISNLLLITGNYMRPGQVPIRYEGTTTYRGQ